MQTKRGFTLVEVVVALGILALVFSGVVTLVVQVVNLELGARRQTEAVALAQGKMAEQVALICDDCSETVTPEDIIDQEDNGYIYDIYFDDGPYTNFVTIKVVVTWTDKGIGDRDYSITQAVRK